MMEYTEGKWWVEVSDDFTTVEAKSQTICTDVSNCDAYLIAQSPRMADLLERLVKNGWNAGISEEAKEILQTLA